MKDLNVRLHSLAIFRNLLKDPVIAALCDFLQQTQEVSAVSAYAQFVAELYRMEKRTLAGHIQSIVGRDENAYIRLIGRGETPWPEMEATVMAELQVLQEVADLTPEIFHRAIKWKGHLPGFGVKRVDLVAFYRERCRDISKFGYGIYAKYHMFYVNQSNKIVPVRNPDRTRLESLVDYEREQKIIMDNTIALLEGRPAANILLTGDAGTGKSSTVKAVVNELYQRGLRILEVRKEQLHDIAWILDELSVNPLKFILFIDDLSFQKDDDNFSALKAVLEGSVSAKSSNVVIYATSNRRHLVKETFSSREGDDVHRNDTIQEVISLSERFGIRVTFQKPNKKTYIDIVHHLARERGLDIDPVRLEMEAEQYALGRGGRSARAASQFIDSLMAAK